MRNLRKEGGARRAEGKRVSPTTPDAARQTPHAFTGLTLVEVLMSLMVTGIGVLGVVALLPLAFVRAVQATNLTNGTILRYNAESLVTVNPRLLLRWQPNQQYQVGDIVLVPTIPGVGFQCTTAGTSGLVQPTWVATVPGTTTENVGTSGAPVWSTQNNLAQSPTGNPPPRYVIDPVGWYALGSTLQGSLGNNGAATPAPDPAGMARYNGETLSAVAAARQAYLPDSWTEQSRAPVSASTVTSATLMNVDLSAVTYSAVGQAATVAQPYTMSRIVMMDATGKFSHTRFITNIASPASSPVVSWSTNDPLPTGFTAATARVETQETRYTWMLTVMPSTSSILSNIQVTVFFNRTATALDEQVFQEQTPNADGVTTPFHFVYTSGKKPFVKKGSFLFDCYYGRWYRVVNVLNDTGTAFDIIVDQPRQQADMLLGTTFGAVFMRGVVDVFPITPQ
jgi:Tfp pilus assembly protein PilV